MDHAIDFIMILFLLYLFYDFWYNYFSRSNKMTDQQLINTYIHLRMKGIIK